MNTFLNQWSTRAIWMYAQKSKPVCRSATVVVVEDMTKPFKRRDGERTRGAVNLFARDYDCRHLGGGCARAIRVHAVADIKHIAGIESPPPARRQKTAGAGLERGDLGIAPAQDDREVVAHAERVDLLLGRIIREDADLHTACSQELEQVDEAVRTAPCEVLQRPLNHPLVDDGGHLVGRHARARRRQFQLTCGTGALAPAEALLGLAIGRKRTPDRR